MKLKMCLLLFGAILALNISIVAQIPGNVPKSNLNGWWSFNGHANDLTNNGNHGTVYGATLMKDRNGNVNGAYYFNGTSDYIALKSFFLNSSTNVTDLTYYLEFKIDQLPKNGSTYTISGLQSYWRHKMINIEPDGTIRFHGTSSNSYFDGISPVNSIQPNHWYCAAIIFSSSNIKLYLDGLLVDSVHTSLSAMDYSWVSGGNQPSYRTNYFGGFHVSSGIENYFNGSLDNFGIWNRALTIQEINRICQNCQPSIVNHPASQTIKVNTKAHFMVSSSDTDATYQWQTDFGIGYQNISNAGQYSGATSDTLTIFDVAMSNNNQAFRCVLTSDWCMDTSHSAILKVNTMGIQDPERANLISITPNPTQGQITVKVVDDGVGVTYSIYNFMGMSVMSGHLKAENTSIDLGKLSEGIYVLNISERGQSFRVIKSQ